MISFYAQPYNIDATGFYFSDLDQYEAKAVNLRDAYGNPVEEFEIQFIDGTELECALAKAMSLSQANMERYLEILDDTDEEIIKMIVGLEEGYDLDEFDPESVEIWYVESLADLAEQWLDEGVYGDVPDNLRNYLDTEAMGRDLGFDGYTEASIAGTNLVYTIR
jgi:hypothetical protein